MGGGAGLSQSALLLRKQLAQLSGHNNIEDDVVVVDDAVERKVVTVVEPTPLTTPLPDLEEETNYFSDYTSDYQQYNTLEEEEYNTATDYDYDYTDQASDVPVTGGDGDAVGGGGGGGGGGGVVCPGGDLYTCIDVCPGQFGARVFGLCVATCGRRCP